MPNNLEVCLFLLIFVLLGIGRIGDIGYKGIGYLENPAIKFGSLPENSYLCITIN
jgi:hypothetical protein